MELSEPRALNRAASYCSRAERCEQDVRKKLKDWNTSEDCHDRIIKRLQDEKFLSDERFCNSFVNDKVKFNRWGKTKIIFELKKRKIPESIYLPVLERLDDNEFEDQLILILSNKVRSVKGKNSYEVKTKLIRFALGRGFSMDLSVKCADKILGGNNDGGYEENI